MTEPRDPDGYEPVANYVPPPGYGTDDFPSREPRFGFSDWLLLAVSVLGILMLAASLA